MGITKLDRQIAEAWQAVRWAATDGRPVCPTCFDGADLEPRPADPRNPALRRYHCTTCKRDLSDWSGTWIAPLKQPLVRWAWLIEQLAATPQAGSTALGDLIGLRHHTISAMRAKLADAPGCVSSWRTQLRARGLTLAHLTAAAQRSLA